MKAKTQKVGKLQAFRSLVLIRNMGIVNMWGAAPVLRQVYPDLTEKEAKAFNVAWMESFRLPKAKQPRDGRESWER